MKSFNLTYRDLNPYALSLLPRIRQWTPDLSLCVLAVAIPLSLMLGSLIETPIV